MKATNDEMKQNGTMIVPIGGTRKAREVGPFHNMKAVRNWIRNRGEGFQKFLLKLEDGTTKEITREGLTQ